MAREGKSAGEAQSRDPDDAGPLSLSEYAVEDYVVLVVFWLLAVDVFTQFFSRFFLGDSIAWTEEMARYLLIMVGFLGSAMAVRKNTHILLEFLHRYMSSGMSRAIFLAIDVGRFAFFAIMAYLTYKLADKTSSMMVSIDVSKDIVYYVVCLSFALMAIREAQRMFRGGWYSDSGGDDCAKTGHGGLKE